MKAGWQTIPMGQICSIKSGKSDTKDAVEDGAYAFFDRSRTIKKSSRYLFDCEAMIIPGEGTEFLPRHFTGKFDLHQRAYALFDFSNQIDVKFLYYFLHYKSDYFPQVAVGATVKSLRLRHFEQLPVSFTSIPEQQRIVGILDEAFDGITTAKANAEQNLQNARALFESHLQSVFAQRGEGWVDKPLTAVCEAIFAGGDVPKDNYSKTETDKYRIPIFTNGEKNKGLYGFTNTARVTAPSITISARGTIGYSEIRRESYYPAIRLIVVIPKKGILDLSFLYYAIESIDIVHSGTSIPQLTVPMVSGFSIPVPPVEIQQMIVDQLDALREETQRLESLYQRKLAVLDELKKSLLHQAFSGAL